MKKLIVFIICLLFLAGCSEKGKDGKNGKDGAPGVDYIPPGVDRPATISDPRGKGEKGPCKKDSDVYIYPLNTLWKQVSAALKGYTESNDGSYQIYADVTSTHGRYELDGTCYNEVDNKDDDGVQLRLMTKMDSPAKNLNPATTIQEMVVNSSDGYFRDEDHTGYRDSNAALEQARVDILAYFNLEDHGVEFSAMSLQGDASPDAVSGVISAIVAQGRTGPEQNDFMREIAEDIISQSYALQIGVLAARDALPFKLICNNLSGKYAGLGINATCPPFHQLNFVPDYYELLRADPVLLQGINSAGSGTVNIDAPYLKFAYPMDLTDPTTARYLAAEISGGGQFSIWSVGTCTNGPCPDTRLVSAETMNEILISPTMAYNGMLGAHSLTAGQCFLVQALSTAAQPSHASDGDLVPFGRNLATNTDWENAVGYANTTTWFRRSIKANFYSAPQ